jgi:hypothetical protein
MAGVRLSTNAKVGCADCADLHEAPGTIGALRPCRGVWARSLPVDSERWSVATSEAIPTRVRASTCAP